MLLDGRVAIVTGGGVGIGRIYCEALAREGADVVVADIDAATADNVADSIRRDGGEALGVLLDVTDPKSTEEMTETVIERFGRVDVLVNNAALYSAILPKKAFFEITPSEWDRVMSVNTKGVFLCVKAVFPAMSKQRAGKIINVASATAFSGATGFPHYVASKAAVIGLTRALARELGKDNITVNAIAPGLTSSETTDALVAGDDVERQVRARALARVELPEDIVGTLLFLASAHSDFLTGQTLVVDGGGFLH